jgi:hypothetical protein
LTGVRRGSPDCLQTPAVCRNAGHPPGSGLGTCPSVGEVARSGDVATTWSVIAKTPGKYFPPFLRTRFILVPMLFSAHVGEHVERNVPLATSADARLRRPVGLTALRRTDVFAFEPGPASWKHAPTPERCPRQEPLGRNRPPTLTQCYKVSGPSALPPRFEPVDPMERD